MDRLLKDVSLAIRQFRRQPGFALTVISTLMLAIGANIAVFSVVNAVLFRALPFTDPERLVWITSVRADNPAAPFSLPEFIDYKNQARTVSIGAYANWRASLTGETISEGLQGARMSANAFQVLGLSPAAGRLLQDSDDRPDAPKVVVLSYRLWLRQFGGSPAVLGRSIRLNGESFAVAGILPQHFPLPLRDIDVVIPLVPDQDPYRYVRNSTNFLLLFGRLNLGLNREQAQTELTGICRSLRRQFPVEYARKDAVRTVELKEALIGEYRETMLLLLGAVLVVLGAALANLISLVLVRASERKAELSLRIAIGASHLHLIRQLVVESLLFALIGSALAWIFATLALLAALPSVPASIPRVREVTIDGSVVGFATLITIVITALLALVPLGAISKVRISDMLRLSRGTGDRWSMQVRQTLVIGEISVALLLILTTSGLLQNVVRLQHEQLGFSPDSIFQARISIPPTYKSPEDLGRFYDRLSARLSSLPGVQSVGVISVAPLSGLLRTVPFAVEGDARSDRDMPSANLRLISPGYLPAVGTRLLKGRLIKDWDRSDTPPVALVSSALADRFLKGWTPGQRVLMNDNTSGLRPVEVVGVVEDVHHIALDAPPSLDVYVPLRQVHPEGMVFLRNNHFWMIRTSTPPAAFRSSFLTNLRAVDEDAAISATGTMRDYVDATLGPRRFNLGLFASFSLTAVLLAVSGLYGLVSCTVNQRQREIGVRITIGATESNIHWMILRQAGELGLTGLVLGGCVAVIGRPLVGHLAQDVSIPFLLAATTTGFLFLLILLAAWLPARRAARISPVISLRAE